MTRVRNRHFATAAQIPSTIALKEQHGLDWGFDLAQINTGKLSVETEMTPLALVAKRAPERLLYADVLLNGIAPVPSKRRHSRKENGSGEVRSFSNA